jgi:hypothetical protein
MRPVAVVDAAVAALTAAALAIRINVRDLRPTGTIATLSDLMAYSIEVN